MSRLRWAIVVSTLVAAGLIGLAQLPDLIRTSLNRYQSSAIIKLGNFPRGTQESFENVGRFDWGIFSSGWWTDPQLEMLTTYAQIHNPRFQAGSYLTVFALPEWARSAPASTLPGDYRRAMMPFVARTNALDPATGHLDTASIYPHAYLVNLTLPSAIDSAMAVYTRHLKDASQVKLLMLDFCSDPLPDMLSGYPMAIANQTGKMDLDLDGIDYWNDPDERIKWRDANHELVARLKARLPGMKLIPNGQLAIFSPSFASLVDGCYVESFPRWFFGGPKNYANAIDPNYPHSLWQLAARKGPSGEPFLVFLEDAYGEGVCGYLAAMWDNVVEVRRSDQTTDLRPLNLLALGKPLGPATYENRTISRHYEKGIVWVRVISESTVLCGASPSEAPGAPQLSAVREGPTARAGV